MTLTLGADTFLVYCGRCLAELERAETGATVCPNGCPP